MVGIVFQITLGNRTWKVTKRRNDFAELNGWLEADISHDGGKFDIEFPVFKDRKQEDEDRMKKSMNELVEWLQKCSEHEDISDNQHFLEFCEVSNCTFNLKGCIRYKEGMVNKRSGGRYKHERRSFFRY